MRVALAQAKRGRNEVPARGFTFVEVLVTTIVVGLLAALVIPSFLGTRDRATGAAAQSLLRMGATAMESGAVEPDTYETITTADLEAAEPAVQWTAIAGAEARDDAITLSALGPSGYTLTTTSESGVVYELVKDLTGSPTVTRTCGPGCTW